MTEHEDHPAKHPYRDLGPLDPEKELARQHKDIEAAPPELKQSVYQTPIKVGEQKPALPQEMLEEIAAKKKQQEELIQKWMAKRKMHCIGSAVILGITAFIFSGLAVKHYISPIGAGIIGVISGAYIGYHRSGDVWAKIVYVIPQIIWSIISIGLSWQFPGIGVMTAILSWLVQLVVATLVSMKIQLDESAVV